MNKKELTIIGTMIADINNENIDDVESVVQTLLEVTPTLQEYVDSAQQLAQAKRMCDVLYVHLRRGIDLLALSDVGVIVFNNLVGHDTLLDICHEYTQNYDDASDVINHRHTIEITNFVKRNRQWSECVSYFFDVDTDEYDVCLCQGRFMFDEQTKHHSNSTIELYEELKHAKV